jgi:decaprenylphospho-beta-D-ribofuranose 2-oxidase
MARYIKHELSSWGNYPREEVYDFRPDSPTEIGSILKSQEEVPHFISRGLGRSYGDAALNAGGGVIRQERLNRLLDWDPQTGTVDCEAGVTYEDLLNVFLPRGYFPAVTPGTKFVTMGGAVAADVHGKNHHKEGSLASFIDSLTLLTGTNELLTCSPTENADIFWATVGGMGLTGVIQSVKLKLQRVESAYINVEYQKAANLDAALEEFGKDHEYRYSVAWIDCLSSGASLGRSVLMRGDHVPLAQLPPEYRDSPLQPRLKGKKSVPLPFPNFALNSVSVRIFNKLYYGQHQNGRKIVDYDNFFYPLDSILNWNRIYGKRGFVQYQMVVPMESARSALLKVLEKLSRSKRASFLAVLKTFGPGNQGLLSFPMKGATLALDLPNTGQSLLDLLEVLDKIVLDHGGRVYLAKDARLSRQSFESMYPRHKEFAAIKDRVDPAVVFSSSLARRLGLAPSS